MATRDLTGKELTPAMKTLLDFIIEFRAKHNGILPTVREMMEGTGDKSPNGITGKLNGLEARGVIRRPKDGIKSRSLEIVGMETGNVTIAVSENSRTGENFAVNIVGEFIAFMIFNNGKMIESGLFPLAMALKMADRRGVNADLPTIERIAELAKIVAKEKIGQPAETAESVVSAPPVETAAPKKVRKSKAAKSAVVTE